MPVKDTASVIERYLGRLGYETRSSALQTIARLRTVIVIPCFNEPDVGIPIRSLITCGEPMDPVLVIVVVNSGAGASVDILEQNARSVAELERFGPTPDWFHLCVLDVPNMPRKHAGVGLARKIGMDEGLRQLLKSGTEDKGVLVGLDSDSEVDSNYLCELETHFEVHDKTPGCSIRFEHPLEGTESTDVYEAIVDYELHLRCFIEGQRLAGLPFAFQTIGSSMAVRARAYAEQGGMNKRKAGEDFYFLQKIIPMGGFTELNTTCVRPSPRISDRVPFGTGKAVGDAIGGVKDLDLTYAFQTYGEARALVNIVPQLYGAGEEALRDLEGQMPEGIVGFLKEENWREEVASALEYTSNAETFSRRFFQWFDAFLFMKCTHFLRDNHFGSESLIKVANKILERRGFGAASKKRDALILFRRIGTNCFQV